MNRFPDMGRFGTAILVLSAVAIGAVIGLASPGWALALVGLVAIPAVWLSWRFPEVPLALFLMAGAFKAGLNLPIDLTAALAGLALFGGFVQLNRHGFPRLPREFWLFFVFVLVVGLGAALGGTNYGVDKAVRLAVFGSVAVLVPPLSIREQTGAARFAAVLAFVGFGMSLVAVGTGEFGITTERLTALGSNTITLGRAAGLSLGFAALSLMWRRPGRWASAGLALASAVALLGSGSRGPAAALVVGLGLVVLVRLVSRGMSFARVTATLVAIIVAAYAAWTLVPQLALSRFTTLFRGAPGRSVVLRQEGLVQAQALFARNPVLGAGTGRFETVGGGLLYPHNLIAEVSSENGIFGLLVIGSWLAIGTARAFSLARRVPSFVSDFVLFGVVFGLVNAMVSGDLNDNRVLYAFVSIAFSGVLLVSQSSQDEAGTGAGS